ncbi:Glycoside hydrolase family 76 protein [Mycena venus]|uniref:Glycoside hydrolase family 76 protein n=1 Tax=Mycena venus TaxID=2733690 RepID=A0A8H6X2C8_9AGAR|nr:Glycoside hydrolase family 76 protein [Mycena venus]
MVGGTFQGNPPGDPTVEGLSTGLFLVLSALLAETTSDPVYLQAASDSADFIHSHLYDNRNIVQSSISANDTSGCGIVGNGVPDDSGVMIEGLSILSSITKNISTQNLFSDLLLAVIFNRIWQGDNGIVSYNTSAGTFGSLYLLQGLGSAYTRGESINSMLRQQVGEYITVQFNAVTGLATFSGTDIYGQSWIGPPDASFSGTHQVFALGALISAIGLENEFPPSSTPSSSLSPSSTTPSSSLSPSQSPIPLPIGKSTHTAAIAGGSVGGIIFLALILATLWLLRRQRSPAHNGSLTPSAVPEPFLVSHTATSHPREKYSDRRNPQPPSTTSMPANMASVLPTEQLVQILNQRLQNRRWDEGDVPPDYPAAW